MHKAILISWAWVLGVGDWFTGEWGQEGQMIAFLGKGGLSTAGATSSQYFQKGLRLDVLLGFLFCFDPSSLRHL